MACLSGGQLPAPLVPLVAMHLRLSPDLNLLVVVFLYSFSASIFKHDRNFSRIVIKGPHVSQPFVYFFEVAQAGHKPPSDNRFRYSVATLGHARSHAFDRNFYIWKHQEYQLDPIAFFPPFGILSENGAVSLRSRSENLFTSGSLLSIIHP